MKKLILILSIIAITSCNCEPSKPWTKGDICRNLLDKRANESYYNHSDAVRNIDTMFLKCGCDTLK